MDKRAMAKATYNNCAQRYQDRFMDMDLYHDTYDLFCDKVTTQNATIFEIACGPGNITRYLLDKRPDFTIDGMDLAPNMIDLARVNVPQASFQVMDCSDISSIDKTYDAIMCGFCLPYISVTDSVTLIKDAAGLLKTDGIIYLSMMEGNPGDSGLKGSSSSTDKLYIHYHEADWLTETLTANGFEVIDLQRKHYDQDNGGSMIDLFVIAKRK